MRAAIMRLRNDPTVSATMAGVFTQTNAAQLAAALGRQPSEGELYIAHFLGSDGAAKLIRVAASQPRANAAEMFPQAAAANPSIFMNKSGQPRSFERGLCHADRPLRDRARHRLCARPARDARRDAGPPDTAGVTRPSRKPMRCRSRYRCRSPATAPEARPFFQSMFTDRGNGRGDADRQQSVDAGARPMRRSRAGPRSCSICSATRPAPMAASQPAARSRAAHAALTVSLTAP